MTALSTGLALIWFAGFWLLTRDIAPNLWRLFIGMIACIIGVGIAAAGIWPMIAAGYPDDSYWTLGIAGRAGVLSISLFGVACVFWLFAVKTRIILSVKTQVSGTAWALFDIAIGMLVFGVVLTVSPQVFYTFYQFIFEGLPSQWVIDGLFDTPHLQAIATFQANANLADHIAGVVLWAIVPFTGWLHLQHWWRG